MLCNPLSVGRLFIASALLLTAVGLTGCGLSDGNPWSAPPRTQQSQSQSSLPPATPPVPDVQAPAPQSLQAKVSILLPLSGKGSDTGQAMLNAAQLAMFDLNATSLFELLPEDTGRGAGLAANDAIANGAQIIIGPVFSADTKTVSPIALQSGVNVVSFSTDTTAAVGNTYLMGFMPQTQVERVLSYGSSSGLKRIALIAPRDVYGDSVASSFYTTMQRYALDNAGIIRYTSGQLPSASDLATLKSGFNAVLIASNGIEANKISNLLTAQGFPTSSVKRLGTGLWDQADVAKLSGLQGAWYAASSPRLRTRFEHRYFETYGTQPPRLASLAYDATALAVVLAKSGQGFGRTTLTNPNGFSGIDGIFRFTTDGIAERGLAVLEVRNGAAVVIQDAPQRF